MLKRKVSLRYFLGAAIIFRMRARNLLFFVALLVGGGLCAAEDKLPAIEFSIKPRLCVLSEGEEFCEDELEISWMSDKPRSLCLYQSDKTLPLRCWEDERKGKHRFALSIASNVEFNLREIDKNFLLVSQEFEVVQDNTQYRRKRRNPWSFF